MDDQRLTNRDLHTIKTLTGHVPPYADADEADPDFVVAFAVIAIRQSGRFQRIDENLLWDAELGKIELLDDEEAAEAGPPLSAPETPPTPSGAPGPTGGDIPQVRSLPATGTDSSGSWG